MTQPEGIESSDLFCISNFNDMGNKKTEAKKRNRRNRRLREAAKARLPKEKKTIYADEPTQSELIHEYAMAEQGFADFLDSGDH